MLLRFLPSSSPPPGGPARQFLGDSVVTYLVLNDIRRRVVGRVYGVTGKNANVVTVVAAGTAAAAVGTGIARITAARPDGASALAGLTVLREGAYAVAGPASREGPFIGLLTLAVMVKASAPMTRATVRASREAVASAARTTRRIQTWLAT